MKNFISILLLATLLVTGCNPNKKEKAEALFTDPVMQDEIFNAIMGDSARLQQFFEKFHSQRQHHMGKMGPMHQRMMKKMCCSSGMDSVMMCDGSMQGKMMRHMLKQTDQDSVYCRQLGDSVMRHDRLRKHLQQRMGQGKQKRMRGNN